MRVQLLAIGVAVGLISAVGCSNNDLKTNPAKGRLVYEDGTPITGGYIRLTGTGGESGNAVGELKPDGTFVLATNEPGDGAPAGTFKVTFEQTITDSSSTAPRLVEGIYLSLAKTPLSVEIKKGENDLGDIKMGKKPKGVK